MCSAAARADLGTLGHRQLARCRACNHRYVARCDDDALAAEYRAAYYATADDPRIAAWAQAHAPVWDAVADQLLALQPAAQRVLDVGAGSGGFLLRLRARRSDLRLAAVEPSPAARAALQQHVPGVPFVADRAEQLAECADGSFDAVTMLQTLEHLRDPLAACRGALRCLRPGGLLLVTVPNRCAVQVWWRGRRADCWANGTHLQFFDHQSLGRLLRTAGFTAVRRLVSFGGGQHRGLLPRTLQYALRALGVSVELRVAARRPTA